MKKQVLKYLPEPQTDFVVSVSGTWEILLGIVALLALAIWLVRRWWSRRRDRQM